ncbi:hypothetical protein CHU95_02200 [Niveispirillum lacus]|uniref:Phage tail collar domain-containing protein n=1 Tax=Niveispirillum lacus TaxID=1981099 RepID=A0A255Z6M4_9PROT|nr:hypothetical protein CHU95_02200 [Niveispirillum lacus]
MGEIALFAFNNTPTGWLPCEGQPLQVQQNTALYALLGSIYGGNGSTIFNLPDLRGRTAVNFGLMTDTTRILPQGQTLTQGSRGGTETVTLSLTQVPGHTHGFVFSPTNANLSQAIVNAVPGPIQRASATPTTAPNPSPAYAPPGALTPLNNDSMTSVGGNQAHENRQPFLALQYCICTVGIFPMRN